ncbi:MAG: leucyl/phenylalanyl-tRNA--protein transferase [Myxococcales bacterium]|nr:leucyl/phenylalanyl-tRNA--protein transferase [Myxococcales bacterium]
MPIALLSRELLFPPPEAATEDGLVAIGGDLSPARLLLAYGQGIFPWPTRGFPLLWFSPDPRFVLEPSGVHLSRSLRKAMRRSGLEIRMDTRFAEVIEACGEVPRPDQDGSWITDALVDGYVQLHERGYAHSVEAYRDGALVGGLYGVCLGRVFFGESMFTLEPNASKVAFGTLLAQLMRWEIPLVDCQVHTQHLERFGAREWSRARFLARLRDLVGSETRRGPWRLELDPAEALAQLLADPSAGA